MYTGSRGQLAASLPGAYSDRYLDGDLDAERLAFWTERMNRPDSGHFTLLAEHRDRPVGFAHVVLDADPTWGALIDNLHVVRSVQRSGVGTLLLVSCSADRHGTAGGFWYLPLGP